MVAQAEAPESATLLTPVVADTADAFDFFRRGVAAPTCLPASAAATASFGASRRGSFPFPAQPAALRPGKSPAAIQTAPLLSPTVSPPVVARGGARVETPPTLAEAVAPPARVAVAKSVQVAASLALAVSPPVVARGGARAVVSAAHAPTIVPAAVAKGGAVVRPAATIAAAIAPAATVAIRVTTVIGPVAAPAESPPVACRAGARVTALPTICLSVAGGGHRYAEPYPAGWYVEPFTAIGM